MHWRTAAVTLALLLSFGTTDAAAQDKKAHTIVVTDQVLGNAPVSVAAGLEDVNHEIYGGIYSQMIFGEAFAEEAGASGISSMWRSTGPGIRYFMTQDAPFKGAQSQRLSRDAAGDWSGVENRGLNRQGLSVVSGRSYEGSIALRADRPTAVRISLQSANGDHVLASQTIVVRGTSWSVLPVALEASGSDDHARFAVEVRTAGTVDIGYALLQPGAWGRFKRLPVRADVASTLAAQGLQAIRFGGCANSGCGDTSEYRWKAMTGDPVRRRVTRGFWYPHESNGFGIFEFLQLGEALGIEAVPSLDIDETPAAMRDLMDYLYGPASTTWGRRRVADGHPAPYRQKRIQLGNENAVDDGYFKKFAALAEIIWSYDKTIRLVVGDFTYAEVIGDPYSFKGGGKVSSLKAHRRILELADRHRAEVDFDVHLWTETTKGVRKQIAALDSYAAALRRIGPAGSRHKVVVFELNANTHDMARALGNAYAITALQQRQYVDVISSANALQVDGHNDNGWDQGLVFMSQASVWTQPPYHVHRMIASSQRAEVIRTRVSGADDEWVQAAAFRDGSGVSLHVVNASDEASDYQLSFGPGAAGRLVQTETLGPERGRAVNTSQNPVNVTPQRGMLRLNGAGGTTWRMPPRSFTTMQLGAARHMSGEGK